MNYIWCEDTGSGHAFWQFLFPNCKVEGKNGISRLRRAVACINNNEDQFYVIVDTALDNPDVLREIQRLSSIVATKSNVTLLMIHSFEFVLLSFKLLEDWVFAEDDELKNKRRPLLNVRNELVKSISNGLNQYAVSEYSDVGVYLKENGYNTEQAAAKLLFSLTRNTGFETDKSKIGPCWIVDCCTWEDKKDDDICGLSDNKIDSRVKATTIFENSVLSKMAGWKELFV